MTAHSTTGLSGHSEMKLVKPRPQPTRIEDAYEALDDGDTADELFLRLRRFLYKASDEANQQQDSPVAPPKILREAGRVYPERPYFFLQPLNDKGWLFERSGNGWVVSKAQKIVKDQNFLREQDPWDVVTLYRNRDGQGTPRISSQKLGAELVSFSFYEQKLNEVLSLKTL
jgi:hypothetical protein